MISPTAVQTQKTKLKVQIRKKKNVSTSNTDTQAKFSDPNNESSWSDDILWVLTVPAIWTDQAKQFMRDAAIQVFIKRILDQ